MRLKREHTITLFVVLLIFVAALVYFKVDNTKVYTNTNPSLKINIFMAETSADDLLKYLLPMYESACLKMYVDTYGTTTLDKDVICEIRQNRAYLLAKNGDVIGTKIVILPTLDGR